MQGHSRHDYKSCVHCTVLNPILDSEPRPQFIQCENCGQDIALRDTPSIINRVIQAIVLSRREFGKAISWTAVGYFLSPFWSHVVDKMFFGRCEIKQKSRTLSLNCELGELKLTGRAVVGVIKNKDEASEHI